MQLCAEHNIQVCVPSTPAQIFHLLRRQMLRKIRKPLVVMTPKSLLRHKDAISSLDDLATGGFKTLISEVDELDPKKVKRIVLCSGKVYYDLASARREKKQADVALLRVEQLYPFPAKAYAAELKKYPNAKEVVWCQEEPLNQGAWYSSRHHFATGLREGQSLHVVARPAAASPAVGYSSKHNAQQRNVIETALGSSKLKGVEE
jgi:2-oxoglutarate dehydrogenase E1 component